MRLGFRYLACPACTKRGVSWRARPYDEDHYSCRYCNWYAFTQGNERRDVAELARLAAANPDADDL